jgi:hypothetical protein
VGIREEVVVEVTEDVVELEELEELVENVEDVENDEEVDVGVGVVEAGLAVA